MGKNGVATRPMRTSISESKMATNAGWMGCTTRRPACESRTKQLGMRAPSRCKHPGSWLVRNRTHGSVACMTLITIQVETYRWDRPSAAPEVQTRTAEGSDWLDAQMHVPNRNQGNKVDDGYDYRRDAEPRCWLNNSTDRLEV